MDKCEGILRVRNGSAMVITLLLLAVVGSISFAIGRLFILDLTMSQIYDDSVVAYYLAESGVEEGLLRYRFNKNAEIEPGIPGEADSHNQVLRNDLESFQSGTMTVDANIGLPNPVDRLYDLRIYFREKDLCNLKKGNVNNDCDAYIADEFITVEANESIKIDMTGAKDENYYLIIRPLTGDKIIVEVKAIITKKNGNETVEYKKLYLSPELVGENNLNLSSESYLAVNRSPGTGNYTIIPPILQDLLGGDFNNDNLEFGDFSDPSISSDESKRVELFIKPIGLNSNFYNVADQIGVMLKGVSMISPEEATGIAGIYSTIKSTGHYGNVTRTLKAEIDRQSGTLYDVFDFVLYKY